MAAPAVDIPCKLLLRHFLMLSAVKLPILFAFDPRRQAILLVGGNKSDNKRWYKKNIPIADKRYAKYLEILKEDN